MTDHEADSGRAVTRLFGALLMAVGGMMAGLCGLCSAGVVALSGANGVGGVAPAMMLVLIFGGPPIVVGVALFIWGRSMWRGPRPSNSTPPIA